MQTTDQKPQRCQFFGAPPARIHPQRPSVTFRRAFTLIELLAVILIIMSLIGVMIGLVGFVNKKVGTTQTQGDIAGLSVAIESYKQDQGVYPTSSLNRISCIYTNDFWHGSYAVISMAEINNSGLLLAQLLSASKTYYHFRKGQTNTLSANVATNTLTNTLAVIVDSWNNPINYYCTRPVNPTATYAYTPWVTYPSGATWGMYCSTGGQVNEASFDLWSYGQDGFTYLPIGPAGYWNTNSYSADDVKNFK